MTINTFRVRKFIQNEEFSAKVNKRFSFFLRATYWVLVYIGATNLMKSVAVEQILAGKSLDVQVETKIKGQLWLYMLKPIPHMSTFCLTA